MNEIAKLNAAIFRNIQILLNEKLEVLDLPSGQSDFLYVIARNQGYSQQELSEHLYIGKSTTARAVKELEDKGYILRKRDSRDGRMYRLYLTEKGQQLMPTLDQVFSEVMNTLQAGFAPEDLQIFTEGLSLVLHNVMAENKTLFKN